jgi:hypothetical protein
MKLILKRIAKKPTYTIGKLYINGKYFCDTLEDPVRTLIDKNNDGDFNDAGEGKIYGMTAIPSGTYTVKLTQSPRFKRILPRLYNVPGFDGVLIHRGNMAADSSGCILVGENKAVGKLVNSAVVEQKLMQLLSMAKSIELTIV